MHGPFVVLAPTAKSHPFEERRVKVGNENEPLKIGRAVARLKAAKDNAIFDCKVLSRTHAVMWYQDGEFFLRDTKSSNGTFVNNERLAPTGEESEARQIFSGDIIQFGVEIVENTNKLQINSVAHGCIYAFAKLFDADGNLVEYSPPSQDSDELYSKMGPSLVNNHQLYQLQQFISEAMHRERQREEKMSELMKIIEENESAAESGWKALVNEDRLLARIETLEAQLAAYSKTATADRQREELLAMIDDKAKFEAITKDSLRRLHEEKSEASSRLADTERSLEATEESCNLLRKQNTEFEEKLRETVEMYDSKVKEFESLSARHLDLNRDFSDVEAKLQSSESALYIALNNIEQINGRGVNFNATQLISALDDGATLDLPNLRYLIWSLWKLEDSKSIFLNIQEQEDSTSEKPEVNGVAHSESEDGDKENVEELKRASESYLKETLELQAKVRDLEAQLSASRDVVEGIHQNLEMGEQGSVSWTPTTDVGSSMATEMDVVEAKKLELRRKQDKWTANSIFLLSLTPMLALLLILIAPLHSRLCKMSKKESDEKKVD